MPDVGNTKENSGPKKAAFVTANPKNAVLNESEPFQKYAIDGDTIRRITEPMNL